MRGDRLPDGDHVLRHVKPTWFDPGKHKVSADAFIWEPDPNDERDLGVSVGWMEYQQGKSADEQVSEVRRTCGRVFKRNDRFAQLRCGLSRSELQATMPVDFVHDPMQPAYLCHSAITGLPKVADHFARTAATLMAATVVEIHWAIRRPAAPDDPLR
jgi:hypothetical protein